eukprot:3610212-Rhodomonas_salina.1
MRRLRSCCLPPDAQRPHDRLTLALQLPLLREKPVHLRLRDVGVRVEGEQVVAPRHGSDRHCASTTRRSHVGLDVR